MKKSKTLLLVAALLFTALSGFLVAETYAKYVSEVTKTGSATVAKWGFTADNPAGDVTLSLDSTVDNTTLVADKIAPGTSGSFPLSVSNLTSEVGIDVSVAVHSKSGCSNAEHLTKEACTGEETWYATPTNLNFYSNKVETAYCSLSGLAGGENSSDEEAACTGGEKAWIAAGTLYGTVDMENPMTGTIKPGESLEGKTVYWAWPYETVSGDVADTTDGMSADTMGIEVVITGTQRNPSLPTTTSWTIS